MKNGKWRAALMLNGKRVAKTFPTKALAEKWRMEIANSADLERQLAGETLQAVTEGWLKHIKATKDVRTHSIYSYAIAPFAQLLNVPTDKLTTFALQSIVDDLQGRKAQLAHDKIRQCFRWATKMGLILQDPTQGMERPRHEREKIVVFSVEEVSLILSKSEHLRHAAAIRLALTIGLRGGEVWGLQWGDWDGENLSINRQVVSNAGKIAIKPPKKNSFRTIPLSSKLMEAIEDRNKARLREGLAASAFMFPDTQGNPTRRTLFAARVWKPLLKECDLKPRGFHHCRHTCATLALNGGVPVTVVSALLGHKDAATTLKIYAHLLTAELGVHRNSLEDIIEGRQAS